VRVGVRVGVRVAVARAVGVRLGSAPAAAGDAAGVPGAPLPARPTPSGPLGVGVVAPVGPGVVAPMARGLTLGDGVPLSGTGVGHGTVGGRSSTARPSAKPGPSCRYWSAVVAPGARIPTVVPVSAPCRLRYWNSTRPSA